MKNHSVAKGLLAMAAVVVVLPIVAMFVWSFAGRYPWPGILPCRFSLRGWMYPVDNFHRVIPVLLRSVGISLLVMCGAVLFSLPCAAALAFDDFRGKRFVGMLIYMPLVIPAVSLGMGLNVQFIRMGLAGTYTGVITVCMLPCIPYAVHMLRDAFAFVGHRYVEQARLLGAGLPVVVCKVMLPMVLPSLVAVCMMCYIVSFSQYFLVYLIGGGRIVTFTMDMFPFIESGDRRIGSVYGVVFLLSTVVMLFVIERVLRCVYRRELKGYVDM